MNAGPSSLVAEQAIIAAVADSGPDALAVCLETGITPASFSGPAHSRVFAEVLAMHAEGRPVAIDLLAERLQARGVLAEIGSWPVFAEMTKQPPFSSELAAYCAEVVALERRRSVIAGCKAVIVAATSDPDALPESFGRLLGTQAHATVRRNWKRVVASATQRAEDAIAGREPDAAKSLSFGFSDLDRIFQPMRRGELVVIAARPSCGKSSLMRQLAHAAAKVGRNVAIESLEVSADDIVDAIAATVAGVNRQGLAAAHRGEQADFLAAVRQLDLPNLHVFDCDRSLAAILARAKAIHASNPLDLLCVDYLGLIADCEPSRGETKSSSIGRVTKALKALALELDCVIVLLAQLNRQSVTDGNREPRLSDLRDSGDVEQDADRVIFLHRPTENPLTKTAQRDTDDLCERPRFFVNLIQAKGRNVGTGIVSFFFRRDVTRFEAIARP